MSRRDPGYRPAPWIAIVILAVLVGIVLGGMYVTHTIDRELAAERWQWTKGD